MARHVKAGTKVQILYAGGGKTPFSIGSGRREADHGQIGTILEEGRVGPDAGWDVYDVRLDDGRETFAYGFNLERAPKVARATKRQHSTRKTPGQLDREIDEVLATKDPAALRRSITTRGHLYPKVVTTRYDDAGKAIDTAHTLKMRDGRVITTTWHDTKAQANAHIKGTRDRDPSKDRVLPGGTLGNFRAITWSY